MAIIISKNGRNAKKLDRKDFEIESKMQDYVSANPEVIPVEDVKENTKMVVLTREFPVDIGSIDALGVDKDGEIYILETKLDKNSDKRKVIAQILEYGAYLYKTYADGNEFVEKINEQLNNNESSLDDILSSSFGYEGEQLENLLGGIKNSFENRLYNFFIVMDKVPEEIKEVIMFINQNSKFDIYAVELEYYEDNGYQIVIPKLFGKIPKKETTVRERRMWDEKSFFEVIEEKLGKENKEKIWELYSSLKKDYTIEWGEGKHMGSFKLKVPSISKRSILVVWSTGKITICYGWLNDNNETEKWREKFRKALRQIEGFDKYVPDSPIGRWHDIPIDIWGEKLDELAATIQNLIPKRD
ncbi:MAG: hypothetical protein J7L61_04925 [Thermoplasmata archaeon]|nr:hypothetical protein [Thermoplasmata archaeon]